MQSRGRGWIAQIVGGDEGSEAVYYCPPALIASSGASVGYATSSLTDSGRVAQSVLARLLDYVGANPAGLENAARTLILAAQAADLISKAIPQGV